jgi:hypothetical protein
VLGERAAQRPEAAPTDRAVENAVHPRRIEALVHHRLTKGAAEHERTDHLGQVEQRALDGRAGQPADDRDVLGREPAHAMDDDARPRVAAPPGHGDVDADRVLREVPAPRAGAAMAEGGLATQRQQRRPECRSDGDRDVADRVDAPM